MNEATETVESRESPYFGLDYYEEKYGAWFFGRESEGGKIITNLRAARLTLLHAESGVGKSSLLRAGAAWRMRRLADDSLARRGTARFVPVVFSSWKDDPVRELTAAIRTALVPYLAGHPEPELSADGLAASIGAASSAVNASLLIMLDQFEEYFIYRSREPVSERFADELADCINRTDLRANFLIAIREDAYAGLGDLFKGRIPNVYGNYLHVEYLDRASAEKAIREPLNIYNTQPGIDAPVTVQDELVRAVLDEVRAYDGDEDARQDLAAANGGAGRVATPLLQLVMETVWEQERAQGSHELRLSTLQNLHGVRMIVDAHLGKALRALGSGERQTAIDMFDHLVTPSGGKIAESVPDLAKRTGHSEDQVGSILEKLDHERIVRPVPAAPGQDAVRFRRYEIFHDVLAPTINRAIAAREGQRRARRLRRFAALAVALLLVTLAVAGGLAYLWHTANTEKLTAESRQLAAEADVNAARDPELSALLAMKALHIQDTNQAEDALRTILPQVQAVRTFENGTTLLSAAFDPVDANLVASADESGVVWIWDVKTGERTTVRMSLKGDVATTGTPNAVAFSPDGTKVAVGYGAGLVALFDARSGREKGSATIPGSPYINDLEFIGSTGYLVAATSQGLALCHNASTCFMFTSVQANSVAENPQNLPQFAAASDSGTVIWTITSSGSLRRRSLSQLPANDAQFSPDGTRVVTAGSDGNVRIYNLATFSLITTLHADEESASKVAFSPDGKEIVAGYSSGRARVWDISTGLPLTLLAGNSSGVEAAGFNASGSEVVTASEDGTIRVWDSWPRELRTQFTDSYAGGSASPMQGAAYIGSRLIALGSSGQLYVFPVSGGQRTRINPGSSVNSADWNKAATELVTAEQDGTVDLWRATGAQYARIRSIPLSAPSQEVVMSSDGSQFAVRSSDGYTVQIRSTQTGQLLRTLSAVNDLSVLAFGPRGQIIAGDLNGQVETWDATARKPRLLGTHGPLISDIEFNQSGSEFATASENGIVTVRSAGDGQQLDQINACPSPSTASFSPNDSKIVVACGDGGASVFNAATGQELTVLHTASGGTVADASFSPDGNSIVTTVDTGSTGCVQVWNAELANPSLPKLMQFAQQRLTSQLTAAEQQEYLSGVSG